MDRKIMCAIFVFAAGIAFQSVKAADTSGIGTAQGRFGLEFEPVEFTPPRVNHAVLGNGITLDHYEEKEPALVTVLVQVNVGSVQDEPGKIGQAEMTADIIRTGGSMKTPGDKLDLLLDQHGAQIGVDTDRERTIFRMSVLRSDLEWGLSLLHEILTQPAFPGNKLAEAVARGKVDLRQRLDSPGSIARELYPQLVYGHGNPWGWTETPRTLDAITTGDLRAFYLRHYHPSMIKLGMSGAVGFDEARGIAEKVFGAIEKGEPKPAATPAAEPVSTSRVYVVPRETNQNVIYIGHEGVGRFSPMKFPIKLLNGVMSGGFTSRLFSQVRTARGLAYSVYGNLGEGTVHGIFFNFAQTKVESTWEVIELMIQIDRELQQAPPTHGEVELARQSDINSFVFFFDTAEKIVQQKMRLDSFGYPPDYLDTYLAKLRAVTPEEIQTAARASLHPDRLVVLIVGAVDDALKAKLEKEIGPVTNISEEELKAKWL